MADPAAMPLYGKVVLVTGGARRLGATVARRRQQGGASVAVPYRACAAEARALVSDMNVRRAGSAAALAADLLDLSSLPTLVQSRRRSPGRSPVTTAFPPAPRAPRTGPAFLMFPKESRVRPNGLRFVPI